MTGVYHPIEIEEFYKRNEGKARLQYLASRWALKEATVKASGCTRLEYTGIYLKKEENYEKKEVLSDGREVMRRIKPKP